MSDPDAEVWHYTFELGSDFTLEVRGQIIGRIYRNDTMPAAATARWFWTITCVRQFVGVTKPSKTDSGFVHTKQEAIEALRAAWALERDWRAEMRVLTPTTMPACPTGSRWWHERGTNARPPPSRATWRSSDGSLACTR